KLQQQLKLTPQLQLAMKMLQMNHLELSELIKQEVEQNPLLETGDTGETNAATETTKVEAVGPTEVPTGDAATAAMDATAGLGAPDAKDAKLKEKDFY